MPLTAIALLLLGAPLALATTECLGYLDEANSWRLGFSCEAPAFCCGTCSQRYCCGDPRLRLSKFQQKRCLVFSPKFVVRLVTAVTLFMAMVTTCCCCFCLCRYLIRRRQRLLGPFPGQNIPMTVVLEQQEYPYPPYPSYSPDPKAGPAPPPQGFMWPPSAPPQHPLYPAGPPVYSPAAPPPYLPRQPAYPGT